LTLLVSIASFSSFAGNEGGVSGGGGNAFVCSDANGNITSVELVDMYEGRIGKDVKYIPLSGNMNDDFKLLAEKIHPGDLRQQDSLFFDYEMLKSHLIDLPSDAELYETNDVMLTFKPKNCKLQPIINFFSRQRILIDRELYNKLDYRNQLALHLHEVIYLHEREGGIKDSRYARQIVAAAFLEKEFHSVNLLWNYNAELVCTTKNDKKTEFFITKNKIIDLDFNQPYYNVYFTRLNGHKILNYIGFQEVNLSVKKRRSFNPFKDVFFEVHFSAEYPGLINYLETNLEIQFKNIDGRLVMKFEGEEGDSFSWSEVTCSKNIVSTSRVN